jgi:serine/threonine protein kinase
VLHQIGNGALGPVFRAYDSERDRLVAIKVFRVDLPPERVHQLVAEFEKLIGAELQHPVIAAPRATGIDANNNAFLAQSFAAADSLDIVMREHGPAPIARALRVATHLAEALDYAAERQILHGALHPRDVLLSEDDIRIVGLGVSRALERVGVTSPVRRPYSAPERINDEGWDERADVFSLAAIVYELLCGKRVAGTGSEAAESLTEVAGCDMDALRRVFALALAADPAYRFGTATAFTDALKDTVAAVGSVAAADPGVTPPKPKSRRPRGKLRVVTPTLIDAEEQAPEEVASVSDIEELGPSSVEEFVAREVELPVSEAEPPVMSEVELTEIDLAMREEPVSIEIAPLSLLAFAPETSGDVVPPEPEDAVVELDMTTPARRKVPAPTPVAIETVASAPDLLLVEEFSEPAALSVEAEPVLALLGAVDDRAREQPDLIAFAEAPEETSSTEEQRYADVEPPPVEEPVVAVAVESSEPSEPAEPRLPAFLNPDFSPPLPAVSAPSHSPIWPIGVAVVIGMAIGFGVGYTVAIRDRGVPASATASSPTSAAVVAQPAPTQAAAAPPSTVVEPLLAPPPAKIPPVIEESAAPVLFDGRVLVRSTPPGARVFVDGKDRGQTPATIGELGRGEHRIRIVRDGYTVAERRVVLSPTRPSQSLLVPLAREPRGKAAAAPKPIVPAPAGAKATQDTAPTPKPSAATAAQTGTLVVESRPLGATVVVDGRVVGTTPLTIGDVRAGNHAVRIERDGYRTWTSTATITGGEQSRLTASLEK